LFAKVVVSHSMCGPGDIIFGSLSNFSWT